MGLSPALLAVGFRRASRIDASQPCELRTTGANYLSCATSKASRIGFAAAYLTAIKTDLQERPLFKSLFRTDRRSMNLEPLEPRALLSISLIQGFENVLIDRDNPAAVMIDLGEHIDDPNADGLISRWDTVLTTPNRSGIVYVDLFEDITPETVQNFIDYVLSGAYNTAQGDTFFHRSIPGFVTQGGGYIFDGTTNFSSVSKQSPVINEFANFAKASGDNASFSSSSQTVTLPVDTDLSSVQPGDRIRLIGRNDGLALQSVSTDFFRIVSVDDANDRLTISASESSNVAPTGPDQLNISWFITSDVNTRGTIAMAKIGGNPDSATSEWFFNFENNSPNLDIQNEGFTTFGRVLDDGMDVIDLVRLLQAGNFGGTFTSVPIIPLTGAATDFFVDDRLTPFGPTGSANDFAPVEIFGIDIVEEKTFDVQNSNPGLVSVSLDDGELTITPVADQRGEAEITVTATGYDGTEIVRSFKVLINTPATLDIDGNGAVEVFTDGLLLIRHMFGFTGDALTNGVIGDNAIRTSSDAITAYINQNMADMLDVDDDGSTAVFTDGLLLIRHLFGFTGNALISGVVGDNATRNTPEAISGFLNLFRAGDPPVSDVDLDPTSDTGELGDRTTTDSPVTIVGRTRPGATVTLVEPDIQAVANDDGYFTLTNVPLNVGDNIFTLQVDDDLLQVQTSITITLETVQAQSLSAASLSNFSLVPVLDEEPDDLGLDSLQALDEL